VVPGTGLAMCGVGYDTASLSVAKHAAVNPKTIERNKRRRERESLQQQEEGRAFDRSTTDGSISNRKVAEVEAEGSHPE
jgi:hypothetical protein